MELFEVAMAKPHMTRRLTKRNIAGLTKGEHSSKNNESMYEALPSATTQMPAEHTPRSLAPPFRKAHWARSALATSTAAAPPAAAFAATIEPATSAGLRAGSELRAQNVDCLLAIGELALFAVGIRFPAS